MRRAYCPGGIFEEGNRNSPCASLTTVIVVVEPTFLALTRTPSICPSSAELTCPERRKDDSACARLCVPWRWTSANATAVKSKKKRSFIGPPLKRYYAITNCGADPLVRAGRPRPAEADQGVGRGPGGPPHNYRIEYSHEHSPALANVDNRRWVFRGQSSGSRPGFERT